jgi:hypothetical protein
LHSGETVTGAALAKARAREAPLEYSAAMARPVLLAVEEDPQVLRDLELELTDRYERHYRVRCLPSGLQARGWLEELATGGEEVVRIPP